jgi:ABC-2 type transport system ATP-binding protein
MFREKTEAYELAQANHEEVVIRQTNLEDVFIQLTGERLQ